MVRLSPRPYAEMEFQSRQIDCFWHLKMPEEYVGLNQLLVYVRIVDMDFKGNFVSQNLLMKKTVLKLKTQVTVFSSA